MLGQKQRHSPKHQGIIRYVTTLDGEQLVFSFLLNGHLRTVKKTELITNGVLEMNSEFYNHTLGEIIFIVCFLIQNNSP